jgi:hypothetical protein
LKVGGLDVKDEGVVLLELHARPVSLHVAQKKRHLFGRKLVARNLVPLQSLVHARVELEHLKGLIDAFVALLGLALARRRLVDALAADAARKANGDAGVTDGLVLGVDAHKRGKGHCACSHAARVSAQVLERPQRHVHVDDAVVLLVFADFGALCVRRVLSRALKHGKRRARVRGGFE